MGCFYYSSGAIRLDHRYLANSMIRNGTIYGFRRKLKGSIIYTELSTGIMLDRKVDMMPPRVQTTPSEPSTGSVMSGHSPQH